MSNANPLTAPLPLGPVTLRNRLVSAPMERNYCDTEGLITDVYLDYLAKRAEAGVALMMTEATYVRADGKGRSHQLGAHDDSCIPGLSKLADVLHRRGALVGCELNHGGRTAQSSVSGHPNVAPSPVPCAVAGGELPRELETGEVYELVAAYGDAAARCAAAGVDVLSIHAAHGYLVHQFLSPLYNHRTDEFADPVLFLNLVIDSVRESAPGVALGMRVSAVEGTPRGLDADATFALITRSRLEKLDFLDISAGSYEAGEWIVQSGEWKPGLLASHARRYRDAFGKPTGVAGRINSPEAARQVLADGDADFVSVARALHADPAFAEAALQGGTYRPCIACNVCIDNLGDGPVRCTVNPDVGRGEVLLPTPKVRPGAQVTVGGAGPAGLTAARELAKAGARVTLVDSAGQLGGRMSRAAAMKSTPDFQRFLDWSAAELRRLSVEVLLCTGLDDELIRAQAADAVVLATGGNAPAITLPGADRADVVDIGSWLAAGGTENPPPACTIWGGDMVAMSVADTLAAADTQVLLVTASVQLAPESGRRAKILVLPRLAENPRVRVLLDTELLAVDHGKVEVSLAGGGGEWVDAPGPLLVSRGVLPADTPPRPGCGKFDVTVIRAGAINATGTSMLRDAVTEGFDAARSVAALLR